MLSPLSGQGAPSPADQRCVAIGIGTLQLPAYLDRPQIVTRLSPNELQLAEFDQWAEPLQDNFMRVLAENLGLLLCDHAVAVFPWKGSTPVDYQIDVEVLRMDGVPGAGVSLAARWSVSGGTEREILVSRRSDVTEPTAGEGYAALVAAQSRTVAALSREIASALEALLAQSFRLK
jgi:uncharacterized lipoprotein YmbA